ncbi:MAG: hypothetical protein FWE08_03805 [Oscillospiraceae bacterium]|nr:hypothetical protein [Oscillospiraceae bacterium]
MPTVQRKNVQLTVNEADVPGFEAQGYKVIDLAKSTAQPKAPKQPKDPRPTAQPKAPAVSPESPEGTKGGDG